MLGPRKFCSLMVFVQDATWPGPPNQPVVSLFLLGRFRVFTINCCLQESSSRGRDENVLSTLKWKSPFCWTRLYLFLVACQPFYICFPILTNKIFLLSCDFQCHWHFGLVDQKQRCLLSSEKKHLPCYLLRTCLLFLACLSVLVSVRNHVGFVNDYAMPSPLGCLR